jgi:hypothetical protein
MSKSWERFAPTAPPAVVVAQPESIASQALIDSAMKSLKVDRMDMISPDKR